MANDAAGGVMPQDSDKGLKMGTDYNREINGAKAARNNQRRDTDPMVEKEGFLGMDDLDKMRRRKIR